MALKVFKKYEGVKIYRANLTQAGVGNPPTEEVLRNDIGNIVYSYDGVGQYVGTLNGAFDPLKTQILIGHSTNGSPANIEIAYNEAGNSFRIDTDNGAPADGILNKTPIIILVNV